MTKSVGKLFKSYIKNVLETEHLPASDAAVNLLAMIAAHESGGFQYVQQVKGPALGLLQMEPFTYHDVCDYALTRGHTLPENPLLLIIDTALAIKAARLFFMRKPACLPKANDIKGLAMYAKRYWNTVLGKAEALDYETAYQRYCL